MDKELLKYEPEEKVISPGKKILVVTEPGFVGIPPGIGKDSEEMLKALAMAEKHGVKLVRVPPKTIKEQINESISPKVGMLLEAPKMLSEPYINMADVEKSGIRGITNNRKKRKPRKKKAKKTHRKKKK